MDVVKRAIMECLGAIYPLGRTESGISVTCFRGMTDADGQPLLGFGDTKLTPALNELVEDGMITSSEYGNGRQVFHCKTNDQPPVVRLVDEIKFNIVECLCRKRPKEFLRQGIELECLNRVMGPDGMIPLVGSGSADDIQKALDELVSECKIDFYEKEFGGAQRAHYRAR